MMGFWIEGSGVLPHIDSRISQRTGAQPTPKSPINIARNISIDDWALRYKSCQNVSRAMFDIVTSDDIVVVVRGVVDSRVRT
jgi:hypothetical protein